MCGYGGESLVRVWEGVDPETGVDSDESDPGEHANSTVFDFGFTEEVHGGEVGEAEGVKTYIADVSL